MRGVALHGSSTTATRKRKGRAGGVDAPSSPTRRRQDERARGVGGEPAGGGLDAPAHAVRPPNEIRGFDGGVGVQDRGDRRMPARRADSAGARGGVGEGPAVRHITGVGADGTGAGARGSGGGTAGGAGARDGSGGDTSAENVGAGVGPIPGGVRASGGSGAGLDGSDSGSENNRAVSITTIRALFVAELEQYRQSIDRIGAKLDKVETLVTQARGPAAAPPPKPWAERHMTAVRAEAARVLDGTMIKEEAAKCMQSLIAELMKDTSAEGDCLAPFFPPHRKRDAAKSFTVAKNTVFLHALAQRLVMRLQGRSVPEPLVDGIQTVNKKTLGVVLKGIISVMRTTLNDGRSYTRQWWWEEVGFFAFHSSPKVYIKLLFPDAETPTKTTAVGSNFFKYETARLASPSGMTSAPSPRPEVPRVRRKGMAGASTAPAASPPPSLSGTQPSAATPGAGVSDENQVVKQGCLYEAAGTLLYHLSGRTSHKWSRTAIFSVAKCLHKMVQEPREQWASQQALINLSRDERNKPCQWWLLLPMLTTISKINRRMCVLESASNEVGDCADGQDAALHAAAVADADDDDEDESGSDSDSDGSSSDGD